MIIEKFVPKEFSANNYLIYDENTKNAILFDPSGCYMELSKRLSEAGLDLKYIFITHMHFDHVGDIHKYQEKYKNCITYAPFGDEFLYKNLVMQCDMFQVRRVKEFKVDQFIDEGFCLDLDSIHLKTISTPGHSLGSSCYLVNDILISGDTLFYEEIGRCDLPGGSFSDMTHSIKEKLFLLDDNTKVFTGHGDNTTIGHEKIHNAYFGQNALC